MEALGPKGTPFTPTVSKGTVTSTHDQMPPDLGLWRIPLKVDLTEPRPDDESQRKDTLADLYSEIRKQDLTNCNQMVATYALTEQASLELCREPSKDEEGSESKDALDYLEGIAALEVERQVFDPAKVKILEAANHILKESEKHRSSSAPVRLVRRPLGGGGFNPADFYVDIFPCDIKTPMPKLYPFTKFLRKYIKHKFSPTDKKYEITPADSKKYNKPKMLGQQIETIDKMIDEKGTVEGPYKDLPAKNPAEFRQRQMEMMMVDFIDEGVSGGVATVFKKLTTPDVMILFDGKNEFPLARCYCYDVVNTTFLTLRQRARFWDRLNYRLKCTGHGHLEHLVIEVNTAIDHPDYLQTALHKPS